MSDRSLSEEEGLGVGCWRRRISTGSIEGDDGNDDNDQFRRGRRRCWEKLAAQRTVLEGRREMEREKVVEYERFGGKKMEKGGRIDEDIGWPPS
jgi:hypothetical protein